jgi:transketolase
MHSGESPEASSRRQNDEQLDQLAVKTIKVLAIDQVERAQSGHPGLPLGAADFAYILWSRFLRHDPTEPTWANRDRFILSAGHGSALLYALLHLAGYDLPLEQLAQFRQWGSMTPGHPEYRCAPGVESTTGPLGQGFANGVGMAIARDWLAQFFNIGEFKIIDHYIYALVSDGDLMEGISAEAASLAGHLGLSRLIYLYDCNRTTIEGSTDLTFSHEDVKRRFQAYGWRVLEIDGHNHREIERALRAARRETARPVLIIGHTIIGAGSPGKAGTAEVHGAPLGKEEARRTKEALGWQPARTGGADKEFFVPEEVRALFERRKRKLLREARAWKKIFQRYRAAHPEKARLWDQFHSGALPENLADALPKFTTSEPMPTRRASGVVLQKLAEVLPNLIGGSADLAPSTNTLIKSSTSFSRTDRAGRNLHFGVREHAMAGICNGMALYGGIIPYCGTFLVFADYMRPAIRLAAMMRIRVIYVFTHDSIFLGEDGPTHQPIEQLASLRAIPNLTLIRPADAAETTIAWLIALERPGPTALVLTRQSLPIIDRSRYAAAENVRYGGYILSETPGASPQLIIIATGSEVSVALEAAEELRRRGKNLRVVNLASWELFEEQPLAYRESVLPPTVTKRLVIEAASPFGWERYAGAQGKIRGIQRFGASAPQKVLAEKFGFTTDAIVREALTMLGE